MNFFYWGGSGLSDRGQREAPLDPIIKAFQLYFRIKLAVYMVLLMAYSLWHVAGKIKLMADGIWRIVLVQLSTIGLNGINFLAKVPKGIQAILTLVCIVSMFNVSAQELPGNQRAANGSMDIKALKVGGSVPDGFWTYEHLFYIDGDTVRKTLAEYKGKLLVLDFWNTRCAPCLFHQKEIAYFKKAYANDLAVVMVNPLVSKDRLDDVDRINKSDRLDAAGIPWIESIVEDDYLARLFPHGGYPHYVWINRRGVIQTITFRNMLDRAYVAPFIDGGKL